MLALNAYRAWSRRRPLSAAFATCFVKGSASDAVAQHLEDEPFDAPRNFAFATFSGAYLGIGQHFVYNIAFTRAFGAGRDWATAAKKVAADSFAHVPLVYLPLYYPFKQIALGDGPYGERAADGLRRYADDAPVVLTTYWKTWPAVHFVSFSVLPPELRIGFVASASFLWLIFLSYASHETRAPAAED